MTTPTHEVLVVEDDETLREAICEALREQGVSCTRCEDGQDALDLLRAGARPCLVLLDLQMPFVDGMNFRRQQLEDPRLADIPVVVVTGHPRKEKEARRLGISVYLEHNARTLNRLSPRPSADPGAGAGSFLAVFATRTQRNGA